jgi:hypothetical protein
VSGWVLLVVDFFLLRCSWCPPCGFNGYSSAAATWASCGGGPWVQGLLLALDAATAPAVPEGAVPIFGSLLAYVVSYAILCAATVGASPGRVLTRKGRAVWSRQRPATTNARHGPTQ